MSKWVTTAKPAAHLTLLEPSTIDLDALRGRGQVTLGLPADPFKVVDVEGNEIHYFVTANGVRFARVVELTGFVLWLQEVP